MLDALAALVKALLYAGLLSCAGAVFAEWTLRPSIDCARAAMQLLRRGALLTVVASCASALILMIRLGGELDEATLSAVFISSSGAATFMQLAGAALLLASANDPTAREIRLSNAALMTLSFAFNGHAFAVGLTDGLIAFVHASAAAWWIGSLWLLRVACIEQPLSNAAQVLSRFSLMATRFIGVLVFAGLVLIQALVKFDELPYLTAYEQLLAVKLGIVVLVLSVATYNRLRLTPQVAAGDARAAKSLRATINLELVLIGAIIAVTAILTTYTSPHE